MNNVGGLFQNLTKPSLVDASGTPTYYNSADDALAAGSAKINAAPRPTVTVTPPTGATLTPTDDPSQPPQMTTQGGGVTYSAPSASLPIFRKQPTFQAASTDPATGLPAQNALALTKGGRLLQIITLAAKGAAAGQAAAEQSVAASGGRRSVGFGTGFEAGMTEPAREAMQHDQVQRSGLQNQAEQMQLDQARTPVSVGGATMPFWMAQRNLALQKTQADINKDAYVTPRNGGVYSTATGQYAPGTEPQDKPTDKQIHSYIGADGKERVVMQRADNSTYEKVFGDVNNPKDDSASKTVETDKGVMQWNPETKKYDIRAGGLPPKANGQIPANLPDIKPNTAQFKAAQDLAYGRMTFPQFRTLFAYSRDAGTKMAIYNKAGELNPNFNPAMFEAGYQLAKNPKVQQQLASMDNVIQAMPDLLAASDAATRTPIKKVNEITNWGGTQFGGQKYSNFHTAQIAFADELSGALGYGSATDMSRDMGFNMTDPNLGPAAFSSAMRDVVAPFINRKRDTLLNQMGIYGQPNMNPAANAPKTPDDVGKGKPKTYKGVRFTPLQ